MKKHTQAFTLVELLLSIGLLATILMVVSVFLFNTLQIRTKSQVVSEVEQQGAAVIQIMTQVGRNALLINSPAAGNSANSVSFSTLNLSKNPTIFDLSAGAIRIKEGAGAAVVLTATNVVASGLTFQNLSRPGTKGTVKIQFTLAYNSASGRNEFIYSKTFYASASLRQQ
ncbi:MAG: hypothetical protein WCT53_00780 [Candidatus Gracilibacteria bacterium]